MEEERCTHFSGNDTIALMLLAIPTLRTRRLSLRGAWVAASPASSRVIDELGADECVVGYGLSEASPNVAQSAWWEAEACGSPAGCASNPASRSRSGTSTGADCPPGRSGEIFVRGWNVMHGYYDKPAETAEAFGGRLARHRRPRPLDEDGRLNFVGRAKDIIRVGGENVAPAEIEDMLHRHPSAAGRSRRRGRPAADRGALRLRRPHRGAAANQTRSCLGARAHRPLQGAAPPRVVAGFEEIGMTASSKVQKKQLAAHAEKLLAEEQLR